MRTFAFGSLRFDRRSIPDALSDLSMWPRVDESAIDPRALQSYQARETAIRQFVVSPAMSIAEICRSTGISTSTLYRQFDRCCATHPDGRIYGFRALVSYTRISAYNRTKPLNKGQSPKHGGTSGAFTLLLERYPMLKDFLLRELRKRVAKSATVGEVRNSGRRIHGLFMNKCRELGIKADEYPFNQDYIAFRSLAHHLARLANESFEIAALNAGAGSVGAPVPPAKKCSPDGALHAFEVVEFDGHKIDLRLTIRVQDPFGLETRLELSRVWILVLLEITTRAVLGYALAYGREYTKDDVAAAIQAALLPHQPRKLRVPGLKVKPGGGFPSNSIPESAYACWDWFRFDNARAHLSTHTIERLINIVGCWTDAGPAGEPNERPFIEQFFRVLADNFAHRVIGTTGSNPDDIVRTLADPGAKTELLMELEEFEDLVEVVLANYNGAPSVSGRSPLEAMAHLMAKRQGFIRSIPRDQRAKLCLIQEARIVSVRGSLKGGRRPHVNFEYAKYTSDVLGNNPRLIGKKVRIYFNPNDVRFLYAYFDDGSELGILTAARPWCYTPHSLRVRQEIFRLKARGKIKFSEGDDPVEAWVKYKRRDALKSKVARNDLAKHRQSSHRTDRTTNASSDENVSPLETSPPVPSNQTPAESSPVSTAGHPDRPKPRELKLKRTITF